MWQYNAIFGRKSRLIRIVFHHSSWKPPVSVARSSTEASQDSQTSYLPVAFWGMLAMTAAVRLIGITRPLLGNFSAKSVIYAMIARNWAEGRAGFLYPSLDCLVGGKRSLHMLECSVSAYLTGSLWRLFGGSLDVWGRATAVVFSTASVAVLFLFVRRRHGPAAALGAGWVLALSPISIIYGQSFMLDASLVFFTVSTFYAADRWLDGGRSAWLLAAMVCFALLLLTKIYMMVLLLPLGVMLLGAERRGWRAWSLGLLAAGLAVVPVALWSIHALHTASPGSPMAGHIYSSLQGNARVYRPPDPLLWTPDFYRQLLDDLTGVILTPVAFMLFLAGWLDRAWRQYAFWFLAMAILVALLPLKFYEMNYYFMATLPPLCIVAGLGWRVVSRRLRPGRLAVAGLLLVGLAVAFRYALRPAFVTPDEDRGVVAAGLVIRQLTAEEEPVVTMHGTAIDLLYYCNRPGWAVAPDTPELDSLLDDYRRRGARYMVVAGPEATGVGIAPFGAQKPLVCGDGFCVYPLVAAEGRSGVP